MIPWHVFPYDHERNLLSFSTQFKGFQYCRLQICTSKLQLNIAYFPSPHLIFSTPHPPKKKTTADRPEGLAGALGNFPKIRLAPFAMLFEAWSTFCCSKYCSLKWTGAEHITWYRASHFAKSRSPPSEVILGWYADWCFGHQLLLLRLFLPVRFVLCLLWNKRNCLRSNETQVQSLDIDYYYIVWSLCNCSAALAAATL